MNTCSRARHTRSSKSKLPVVAAFCLGATLAGAWCDVRFACQCLAVLLGTTQALCCGCVRG
jgi:hypothetical protein